MGSNFIIDNSFANLNMESIKIGIIQSEWNSNITDMNVIIPTKGVGSEFETKVIKINEILIGNYRVKNVIATVPLNEEINSSLIGIGFLKKFKEVLWSLNSNLMRFYK